MNQLKADPEIKCVQCMFGNSGDVYTAQTHCVACGDKNSAPARLPHPWACTTGGNANSTEVSSTASTMQCKSARGPQFILRELSGKPLKPA